MDSKLTNILIQNKIINQLKNHHETLKNMQEERTYDSTQWSFIDDAMIKIYWAIANLEDAVYEAKKKQ